MGQHSRKPANMRHRFGRLGTAAAQLIIEKKYGNMVALQNGEIVPVPLKEVAGKLKTVPVDCSQVRAARSIGISFGD